MLDIIEHPAGIRELRLKRPPVNALDPALVAALRQAIEQAPADGAQALLLSGAPGMFSAGLDVPLLFGLERPAMRAFWADFFGLCTSLARCPIPLVAAITGHSPAGGAVLALLCDYRVMARGEFRIGLNEVQVGLIVPAPIQFALRRLTGPRRAERLLVAGAMLNADDALAAGMIDEMTDVDHVVRRASAWMETLLHLPRRAMLATRALARAELAQRFSDPAGLPIDDFLDGWFHPDTRVALRAMVENLRNKKT